MSQVNNVLPDRPRLRSGCCVFDTSEGLVVRSVAGAFRIEPVHRRAMQRVLARLDGTNDFHRLLGDELTHDAFYALRMLASFAETGLLAEGPISSKARSHAMPMRLDGIALVILGHGFFSGALGRSFKALGAIVCHGDLAFAQAYGAVAIACPDGPDLASLEAANIDARAIGTAWLPVFPFGDGIITGPLFRPSASPCFRCFELRWLGISPSIALELQYFERLRSGSFRERDFVTEGEATQYAALVSSVAATRFTSSASAGRVALTLLELGTTTEATLEPCPQCDVCAAESAPGVGHTQALVETLWFDPTVALAELAPTIEELAGHPCGLASISLSPKPVKSAKPRVFEIAVARFAMPDPEDVRGAQDNWCHGAAIIPEDARTLAIIEALERYSGLSRPSACIWTSYASIASDAILPTELPLFSGTEYARPGFPFQRFDPERIVRWNWGYNLTEKRPVLVPTSAVWYGYDDSLLGESSNGVAAHSSRGHALLNGVLELVERDAFMIHWLHRLSPPQVDLDRALDDRCCAIVRFVEKAGYVVRILDLTTDLDIPVALALGIHEDRRKPALICGAGASLERRFALLHALSELYAATLSPTDLWTLKPPLDPVEVCSLADHSRAYGHPDWLQHASFLWASNRRTAWPKPSQANRCWRDDLTTLIERLKAHGHNVIGVDITGADIARHSLFVVRAIVAGLQPLALGTRCRLGGHRLFEAPVRMGYRDAPPQEGDLNPIPHCFP